MAKFTQVGDMVFKTIKSCEGYFKLILHKYEDGEVISNDLDHASLEALLRRYDETREKHGLPPKIVGKIIRFERRKNVSVGWSTSGFWVVCENGWEKDFSYIAAIRDRVDTKDQVFYKAARAAVALDLLLAKKNAFNERGVNGLLTCDLTSETVRYEEAHIDHADPPFRMIVSSFRAAKGWHEDIPDEIVAHVDKTAFSDEQVIHEFRNFHKKLATLRIVSAQANLSLAHYARTPRVKYPLKIK